MSFGKRLVRVSIKSFYKGRNQTWEGKLERVDGVIDPITRMINLIAVFKNDFIQILVNIKYYLTYR